MSLLDNLFYVLGETFTIKNVLGETIFSMPQTAFRQKSWTNLY